MSKLVFGLVGASLITVLHSVSAWAEDSVQCDVRTLQVLKNGPGAERLLLKTAMLEKIRTLIDVRNSIEASLQSPTSALAKIDNTLVKNTRMVAIQEAMQIIGEQVLTFKPCIDAMK